MNIVRLTFPKRAVSRVTMLLAMALASLEGPAALAARAPPTARHAAAQSAGLRALHLCSGYFSTQAPHALIDATVSADAPLPAGDAPTPDIDLEGRRVRVPYLPDIAPREAVYRQGMGCTLLPIGATKDLESHLLPATLKPPMLDDRAWPLGDRDAIHPLPPVQQQALDHLVDEAFKDQTGTYAGKTWGILVVQDGKIIAERYQHGFGAHIAARTNSMCKSLGASLIGVGVQQGLLDLHRRAPLSEWRTPGDPRGAITLDDLLHMASGLYSDGPQDPQAEIYQSGAAIGQIAALNMMDARPGQRFVYSGSDVNLAMRALREAMGDDAHYPAFPYKSLLWKIGMTRTQVETDWNNDFIVSGQCWSTARDFARLGLLYLADGRHEGEQLLPPGWSAYVRTPAPAQPVKPSIGGDAGYGAQFWLFGGMEGLPADTFSAFGALGQYAVIVPSHRLVIVRRGFDQGSDFRIQRFAADVVQVVTPATRP